MSPHPPACPPFHGGIMHPGPPPHTPLYSIRSWDDKTGKFSKLINHPLLGRLLCYSQFFQVRTQNTGSCERKPIKMEIVIYKNYVQNVDPFNYILRDCKLNFKWKSMQRWQCPIHNGTLEAFTCSKIWKILSFFWILNS